MFVTNPNHKCKYKICNHSSGRKIKLYIPYHVCRPKESCFKYTQLIPRRHNFPPYSCRTRNLTNLGMTTSLILVARAVYHAREGNFTSVPFVFMPPVINVEIDLSISCLHFCGAKPNTSLATAVATFAVRLGSTCHLAAGSCEWLLLFFQREQWLWPNCAFKYALTSFWHRFSDSNI
jgi:hypothetical protein